MNGTTAAVAGAAAALAAWAVPSTLVALPALVLAWVAVSDLADASPRRGRWAAAGLALAAAGRALRPAPAVDLGGAAPWVLAIGGALVLAGLGRDLSRVIAAHRRDAQLAEVARRKLERAHRELEQARQRAEASNQAKSTFLANMSHELRTPLNAIIGYAELLAEDAADEGSDTVDDLEKIRAAGSHLVGLVSDVLDLSKVEAGKMELELRAFDLSQLAREAVAAVEPVAKKRGNTLELELADDEDVVRGDPTKVRQVLLNLMSNAAKFTEGGTITVAVNPPGEDTTAQWIVIEVRDEGIGMSADQVERIFEPFVQADASTTRRFGGTGLGLALSRNFCQLMGGDIEVESTPGEGSIFTMRIPRQVADAEAKLEAERPVISRSAPPVLVVDEDEDRRVALRELLAEGGWRVSEAADGQAMLASLAQHGASLILLNPVVPDMEVDELAHELGTRGELACIPVVAMATAEADEARVKEHWGEVFARDGWDGAALLDAVKRNVRRAERECFEIARLAERA